MQAMVERVVAWLSNVLHPVKRTLVPVPVKKSRTVRVYARRGR